MKILASLGLAAACLVASPALALAGPQGTGLTFTEEVAKKNLEKKKREAAKLQASSDCPAPKTAEAAKADAKSDGASSDTCRAS
ncbi:hypothetical protein [Caulobacter sp. RL271]|jgi:hypothetical protein|uniref:Secreted protein n=1 Tax=Caulobacter segnis TaxID=88688 RepID=A0ABY4ZYS0_9CAUL|nr:hypothetical protein [Caulobacter segnis]USQ97957.1 hypothetical protein MZV50_10625 [Caulobacter segnis]